MRIEIDEKDPPREKEMNTSNSPHQYHLFILDRSIHTISITALPTGPVSIIFYWSRAPETLAKQTLFTQDNSISIKLFFLEFP